MARRPDPAAAQEQARRASRAGMREWASARRLTAVWAERDSEIEARLGGTAVMSYRFKCRHCDSQFSLEQQRDAHEAECGKLGAGGEKKTTKDAAGAHPCKYCAQVFTNFGDYGAHRWAEHREEVLAELARKRGQRKVDERKIDSAIAAGGEGEAPAASPRRRGTSPRATQPNGATCPTCGGVIPTTMAQLVKELTGVGIPEGQAFEAARIARRILVAAA